MTTVALPSEACRHEPNMECRRAPAPLHCIAACMLLHPCSAVLSTVQCTQYRLYRTRTVVARSIIHESRSAFQRKLINAVAEWCHAEGGIGNAYWNTHEGNPAREKIYMYDVVGQHKG